MGESLLSVGIDVGTSTTQVILSRLVVENQSGAFSVPRLEIAQREILYRSPIHFTPLLDAVTLDAAGIREIVAAEYQAAGIAPEQVATGAIIITGETARKENAGTVLEQLHCFAGRFVVTTAGADLESVLAAKGAGAVEYAQKTGETVLHMDIGGGTSNLALIQDGVITQTGCLNVGGRLVKLDGEVVRYVSPVVQPLCSLQVGQTVQRRELERLVQRLTEALEIAAGLRQGEIPPSLLTNRVPRLPPEPVTLSFSGGVADLLQSRREDFAYGDIGVLLGRAIRTSRLFDAPHRLGNETIRATVIGAGCHSTTLSGSTVYARQVSFPMQNLAVLPLSEREQSQRAPEITQTLTALHQLHTGECAVFLPGLAAPDYAALCDLADRLAPALLALGPPAVVVTREDMAKALGQALATRISGPLLCLDGLELPAESYLDVAAPIAGGAAYPVVQKTLVLG